MKFSNYLVEIAGVSIYPIISLLIFVVFFVGVILWALRMNSEKVDYLSNIPMVDSEKKQINF